ncbi:hypothetical protein FA13DRAFT_1711192 [Coprinellus micaceus]|uniref:Uncharacterized protein n=1 Tax=Coprinellus micaceus TaxID=71717 RepID=A0A4Y7T4T8_COPMI|nr:hypothetical protein FA13DRAFT_1711192 [Coprinellus micaceus]
MSFPDPLNGINTPLDQNSPILFKQNLELVQREVVRVQSLAQEVLSGIGGAYCAGMEPMNTKRSIGDLKQAIDSLTSLLRSTGIGALPLLPSPPPPTSAFSESGIPQQQEVQPVPTEAQLLAYANESVKSLYDSLKRKQDSAAVVANLLQQVSVNVGAQGSAFAGGPRPRVASGNMGVGGR